MAYHRGDKHRRTRLGRLQPRKGILHSSNEVTSGSCTEKREKFVGQNLRPPKFSPSWDTVCRGEEGNPTVKLIEGGEGCQRLEEPPCYEPKADWREKTFLRPSKISYK